MGDFKQLPMFENQKQTETAETSTSDALLTPQSPLKDAIEIYLVALKLSGASPHTVKAFKSDLNLLANWGGQEHPIGDFGTKELNRFLHWMLTERGKPCSPKTYARRVTTLKNFFSYLYEEAVIPTDPATAIIQKPVSSPLPEVLSNDSRIKVLKVTQAMRTNHEKPDVRPHMLISLLLQTAIKKSECMALTPDDIDRTAPDAPFIWIRYDNPRLRYKERKIPVHPEWLVFYDEYIQQRQPEETIFDCTARNLEYVLRDVADTVGVPRKQMSFEALRWTAALCDYLRGMEHDKLRQKLGLSRVSWREASSKLQRLTEALQEKSQAEEDAQSET